MRQRYGWIGCLLMMILWAIPLEKSVGQQNPSIKTGNSLTTPAGKDTPPGVMIGGYPNAPVYAIAVSGNDAYVGGAFTTAGGVTVNHIAKWDGIRWLPLGQGLNGNVNSIVAVGSDIYAGGDFTMAGSQTVNHVARWDGTAWHSLGNGLNSNVTSLAAYASDVYAVSGSGVFHWDGNSWQQLGPDFYFVTKVAVVESGIYVDGIYVNVNVNEESYWGSISKWNGVSWEALPGLPTIDLALTDIHPINQQFYGDVFFPEVSDIVSYNSSIYVVAGGYSLGTNDWISYAGHALGFGAVFRWDEDTDSWEWTGSYLHTNYGDYQPALECSGPPQRCGWDSVWPTTLYVGNDRVLIGGNLSVAQYMVEGVVCSIPCSGGISGLQFIWNNSQIQTIDGSAHAFASLGTGVYIGGGFTNYFTSQNIPNTVTPYSGPNNLQLYLLNAAGDAPTISFNNMAPSGGTLPSGIDHVSGYYWQVTGSATFQNGVVSAPVSVLGWVNNPDSLRWLKRTSAGEAWQDIGGIVVDGNLESTVPFTSFSEFAIGTTSDDPLGTDDPAPEKAYEYKLEQNYPNPFNPSTTIRFTMKKNGVALLRVFDVLGRKVYQTSVGASRGQNVVEFKGDGLSSGMYFYRLSTEGFSKTMKMMLVK